MGFIWLKVKGMGRVPISKEALFSINKYRACSRKLPSTEQSIKNRLKRNKKKGKHMVGYKCSFCEYWHVARDKSKQDGEV